MARLVDRWLTATLAVAVIRLAACRDDNGGDAILIETRISDAVKHTGEVLSGFLIGESAFCPGGKTSGGSTGATITTTFRCSDGSLKICFAPTQPSLVQGDV